MAKPAIEVDFKGVAEAIRKAKDVREELIRQLERETEKAALRVANEAAKNAPVKDRFLTNSITASPRKKAVMTWEVGSDRDYAAKQEYEHKTKKGFFRKALMNERSRFQDRIKDILKRVK